MSSVPDKPSKGVPSGWVPKAETEHVMTCPVCHERERFDYRDFEAVMNHRHGGKIEIIETFGPPTRRM